MGMRMENKKRNIILFVVLVLLAVAPYLFHNNYQRYVLNNVLINVMLVIALNFILGFAGQVFLGTIGFFAISSYVTALVTTTLGMSFWWGLLASVVITAVFSFCLGLPTLKLSGFYLALMSTGFIVVTTDVLKNWSSLTNGVWGISNIARPVIFGHVISTDLQFYYLSFVMTSILAIIAIVIEDSRFGRAFKAVRDDQLAAEIVGINATKAKLLAFILSGVYVGVAGALYASFQRFISPDVFSLQQNSLFMCMLVIGGLGSVPGAVIGATLLTTLTEVLRFMREKYLLVYAVVIIITLIYQPGGLIVFLGQTIDWVKSKLTRQPRLRKEI